MQVNEAKTVVKYRMRRVTVVGGVGEVVEFDGVVPADVFKEMVTNLARGEFIVLLEVIKT